MLNWYVYFLKIFNLKDIVKTTLVFQNLQADYSMDSHAKDLEMYANVARNRRRRAKALLDFERHDDDELGFRKNDIITVRKNDPFTIEKINKMNFVLIDNLSKRRALLDRRIKWITRMVSC